MDDALRQRYLHAQEQFDRARATRPPSARAPRRSNVIPMTPSTIVGDVDFPEGASVQGSSISDILARIEKDRPAPIDEAAERARRAEEDAAIERRRIADERRKRMQRIEALKLPITSADEVALAEDTLTQTKMVAIVRNWLDSDRPWLTLCGGVGRGKTMAAAWAAVDRYGRYVAARELERLFAARYGDELEAQEKMAAARFLVIDDIGRERDAQGMTTALLELLDQRRKGGRRTIAISNLSRQDFLKRYQDERLHSRLHESGTWGVDTGNDMRRGGKG